MQRPEMRDKFLQIMESQGLTDLDVTRVHKRILDSDDNTNALKAARMYHELKGRLSNRREEQVPRFAMQININLGSPNTPESDKSQNGT